MIKSVRNEFIFHSLNNIPKTYTIYSIVTLVTSMSIKDFAILSKLGIKYLIS